MKVLLFILISCFCLAEVIPFNYEKLSSFGTCINTGTSNITTSYSALINGASVTKSSVGVLVTNAATLPVILASGTTTVNPTMKVLAGGSLTTYAPVALPAGKTVYGRSATGTTISSGIICIYPAE